MTANPAGLSFAAREFERAADKFSGREARTLQYVAVGCMALMALPAVIQALGMACWGIGGYHSIGYDRDDLTHRQRENYRRLEQQLDRRFGDRGGMPVGHSI